MVDDAMKRPLYKDMTAPVVIGVDPARGGMDSTVIAVRQGRDIVAIKRFKGEDTMSVVGHVIDAIEEYKPALTVIDEGGLGYGILDRLTEQRYKVRGVNFGWKAKNPIMWGNKRAEIWGAMRDWVKTASLPQDRLLKNDLTGPMKKPNSAGTIFLEGKKEMKSRGVASPDAADAIAVTFAFPVASRGQYNSRNTTRTLAPSRAVSTGWMGS
jgi:phage terminase large subunit